MEAARGRVFAYGTLEIESVMLAVTGRRFPHAPAIAPGFARYRVAGATYPGMLVRAGERVPGALYEQVDPASLAQLDRFEGGLYERRIIRVEREECSSLPAWAWIVPLERAHRLSEERWQKQEFIERHLDDFLAGLSSTA